MTTNTERQLVVFSLANEVYGVNIGAVREIIRMQAVTHVPEAPDFVEGLINLRGRVIPVVDLRSGSRSRSPRPQRTAASWSWTSPAPTSV